ncbi:MipA/OmpV family protein [Sphingomonas sp. NPDC079357]|uniref:MipA/OmpV family protein n=1 Tax=Sphingomonas sp. NPDC079357 TaxID=3364518 RepID=UPI00384DB9E8
MRVSGCLACLCIAVLPHAALAQDAPPPSDPGALQSTTPDDLPPPRVPMRVQVAAGPQWQPWFPGDDQRRLSPWVSISRTRGDTPFAFGAPDDGTNLTLIRRGRTEYAFALRREGRRRDGDLVPGLPGVGRTLELGGSVETWTGDRVRWRGDVRKGVNGHNGWISQLGLDYVRRDGDDWLVSLGPRVLLGDARYQRAWFGVDDRAAAATGLQRYTPKAGLRSVALTGSASKEISRHWGIEAQATYERLVGDAADSPIIRRADSSTQLQLAVGMHYTFSVRLPDRGIFRLIR